MANEEAPPPAELSPTEVEAVLGRFRETLRRHAHAHAAPISSLADPPEIVLAALWQEYRRRPTSSLKIALSDFTLFVDDVDAALVNGRHEPDVTNDEAVQDQARAVLRRIDEAARAMGAQLGFVPAQLTPRPGTRGITAEGEDLAEGGLMVGLLGAFVWFVAGIVASAVVVLTDLTEDNLVVFYAATAPLGLAGAMAGILLLAKADQLGQDRQTQRLGSLAGWLCLIGPPLIGVPLAAWLFLTILGP